MKTYNYDMDLMVPMQINKEILFNESLITLDSFCNSTIIGFIDGDLHHPNIGDKYILLKGKDENSIVYCTDQSKGWQYLKPKAGMIMFVCKENSFFMFDKKWIKLAGGEAFQANFSPNLVANLPSNLMEPNLKFSSLVEKFLVTDKSEELYLYLNGDAEISLEESKLKKITIIIKQNYAQKYKLSWSHNILWDKKITHQMSQIANAMDVISLYRLPETQHFIGQIVAQNCQF